MGLMAADALGVPKVAVWVLATAGPFPLKSLGSPWGLTYSPGWPGGWLKTPMVRPSFELLTGHCPMASPDSPDWPAGAEAERVQGPMDRLRNLLRIRLNLRSELNDEGKSDVWCVCLVCL